MQERHLQYPDDDDGRRMGDVPGLYCISKMAQSCASTMGETHHIVHVHVYNAQCTMYACNAATLMSRHSRVSRFSCTMSFLDDPCRRAPTGNAVGDVGDNSTDAQNNEQKRKEEKRKVHGHEAQMGQTKLGRNPLDQTAPLVKGILGRDASFVMTMLITHTHRLPFTLHLSIPRLFLGQD